jgi:hypothetical protein
VEEKRTVGRERVDWEGICTVLRESVQWGWKVYSVEEQGTVGRERVQLVGLGYSVEGKGTLGSEKVQWGGKGYSVKGMCKVWKKRVGKVYSVEE